VSENRGAHRADSRERNSTNGNHRRDGGYLAIRILIQNVTLNHCQTEENPKGGDHGPRKGRKEDKDG
jgi:hypothetical protein